MKTITHILALFFLLEICSCGNSRANAQRISDLTVNEIINTYDPILSTIQYNYRVWLENENKTYFSDNDLFGIGKIKDISYIDRNITHLMNARDSVKSYLKDLAYVGAEYGEKLKSTIKDSDVRMEFQTKWREYQEGLTKVMVYDIEWIGRYLEMFNFLLANQAEFQIEEDKIYFYEDDPLAEFNKLLGLIIDSKLITDQETERIKTIHKFSDALTLVQDRN